MEEPASVVQSDFQCPICCNLLYEPVTVACGHTFCKACLVRSLDYRSACPVCRATIHSGSDAAVNVLLRSVLLRLWPFDYGALATPLASDQRFSVPLLVLETVLLPSAELPIHVFEPRYRLMLRRCLQGHTNFGIVALHSGRLGSVGTMAVVTKHATLNDGRSLLTVTGGRRFRVLDTTQVDGYCVANAEFFDDCADDPTTTPAPLLHSLPAASSTPEFAEAARILSEAQDATHFAAAIDAILRFKLAAVGQSDSIGAPPSDPATYSFWFGALLPLSTEFKQNLLESTSPLNRLVEEFKLLLAQSGH